MNGNTMMEHNVGERFLSVGEREEWRGEVPCD